MHTVKIGGLIGGTYYEVGDRVEVPEDRVNILETRGVISGEPPQQPAKSAPKKAAKKKPKGE
jgi:hypothetical protein